jgi:hypothetical protein
MENNPLHSKDALFGVPGLYNTMLHEIIEEEEAK